MGNAPTKGGCGTMSTLRARKGARAAPEGHRKPRETRPPTSRAVLGVLSSKSGARSFRSAATTPTSPYQTTLRQITFTRTPASTGKRHSRSLTPPTAASVGKKMATPSTGRSRPRPSAALAIPPHAGAHGGPLSWPTITAAPSRRAHVSVGGRSSGGAAVSATEVDQGSAGARGCGGPVGAGGVGDAGGADAERGSSADGAGGNSGRGAFPASVERDRSEGSPALPGSTISATNSAARRARRVQSRASSRYSRTLSSAEIRKVAPRSSIASPAGSSGGCRAASARLVTSLDSSPQTATRVGQLLGAAAGGPCRDATTARTPACTSKAA